MQFIHAVLRSALQHAVREDLIGRNVVKLVSPPTAHHAHVLDDAKRKLADRMDGLFGHTDLSG